MNQHTLFHMTGLTELPIGAELIVKRGYGDQDDTIELELGGGDLAGNLPNPCYMQVWYWAEYDEAFWSDDETES